MSSLSNSDSDQSLRTNVAVIGSGPGGYVAAIRLGQLGKSVILIEKEKLGGVCVNVGCIPSKALISASKLVKNARSAAKMGIDAQVAVNIERLQKWKQSVVDKLVNGISILCRVNNVRVINGEAKFLSQNELEIREVGSERTRRIEFDDAIIASGSSPIEIPSLKHDGSRIISSTDALGLSQVPKRMLIVGGGVVGLEIGMAYANLFGTELTIVEFLDQLLPGIDPDLVNVVSKRLRRLGANVHLKSKVKSAKVIADWVSVTFEDSGGSEHSVDVENVLVSVGRRPNTARLGLEKVGVQLDENGFIKVDKQMRTSTQNIYAVGDVVGGPLLAHKASREGVVAAEVISGMQSSFDNVVIPSAIFTDPEIAVAGLSPHDADVKGIEIKTGKFPFLANGKALTYPDVDGFAKVISEKQTGRILGVEVVGEDSSDLISEASLALEMGATLEDVASTIHPHPTLPETLMEAAENALGKAIHIQNRPSSRSE